MADTGHCAGLDRHDCVSDSTLSRDCLEIDMGLVSAMELDRAALQDICDRRAEAKLPKRSGMGAGVVKEGLGSVEFTVLR